MSVNVLPDDGQKLVKHVIIYKIFARIMVIKLIIICRYSLLFICVKGQAKFNLSEGNLILL